MPKRGWPALVAAVLLIAVLPGAAGAATVPAQGLWDTSVVPPCIADNSTPACDVGDYAGVELRVTFQTSLPIYVVGVRFYRADTGTWSGSVWDANGSRIESAASSSSSAGWQDAYFSSPVSMLPSQTYITSYFAPTGGYALQWDYFTNYAETVGSVTALASVDGNKNGVYSYDTASAFPTESFRDSTTG
jgi:hypothetical protein